MLESEAIDLPSGSRLRAPVVISPLDLLYGSSGVEEGEARVVVVGRKCAVVASIQRREEVYVPQVEAEVLDIPSRGLQVSKSGKRSKHRDLAWLARLRARAGRLLSTMPSALMH